MSFRTHARLPRASRLLARLLALSLLAALFVASGARAFAADRVDRLPFVNNFATARFKILSTVELGAVSFKLYGEGETVQPDRVSAWLGSDLTDKLVYTVQIGNTIYSRVGDQPWKQGAPATGEVNAQPLSAQFNTLNEVADAIYNMGQEKVGDRMTDHYQLWLSGSKLLEMSGGAQLDKQAREQIAGGHYKYDFWISPEDHFLYQQNVELMLPASKVNGTAIPATTTNYLITYYDINDPSIAVNAPQ